LKVNEVGVVENFGALRPGTAGATNVEIRAIGRFGVAGAFLSPYPLSFFTGKQD